MTQLDFSFVQEIEEVGQLTPTFEFKITLYGEGWQFQDLDTSRAMESIIQIFDEPNVKVEYVGGSV